MSGSPTKPSREAMCEQLPGALERGELMLSFQPQVCLASGKVIGADVRPVWCSPAFGELAPEHFKGLIEELGLGSTLFQWVLRTACEQASAWHQAGLPGTRMYVEAWGLPCVPAELGSVVLGVLAKTGMSAQSLVIGIPEPVLQMDERVAAAVLHELQAAGIETVLSGFGAGLSDLPAMSRLPVDLVGIDGSLIQLQEGTSGTSAMAVIRALTQFAHGLNRRVMVEGVTCEEQLRDLAVLGCDIAQGSCLGQRFKPDEFERMLASGPVLPDELSHRQARQRTLLLVDDEENILSSLKRLFRREGYRILTASSGIQGLELLAGNPVDVILSDQRMPGMTGVEFLRQAKEHYPNTVRITLSGYTDLQSIIDAVNEGAVYKFLTKPWDDERLRDHVAQAFRQCELAEENRRLGLEVSAVNRELASANQRLERMIALEHERRRAMQAAAGASRDMLDLLPMAVFGVGAEGILAYANRCAVRDWPSWAAALGDEPEPQLLALLARLDDMQDHGAPQGVDLGLDGRQVTAWKRKLSGEQDDLGSLLILHETQSVRKCEMESSA